MATVPIEEAKVQLDALFARALSGEEIVIANGTAGSVLLAPISGKRKRVPGRFQGQFTLPDSFFDPMTEEELKEWGY